MSTFKLGDNVEALDEFGVWVKGKIVAIEQENFHISFDGFGSMWNHCVSEDEIRTETKSQMPTKRSRQPKIISDTCLKRLQKGDKVHIVAVGEVSVHEVDPIMGKLIVELQDGEKRGVGSDELCHPQIQENCAPQKAKRRKTQPSKEKRQEVSGEVLPDDVATEQQHLCQQETETEKCWFIYFLRDDGMWLRVGDIVSVEGIGLPFIICTLCRVDGCVSAKLVNIHNSGLREDFVITCNVLYIVGYSGGKVGLKGSVKEKVEQDANVEFCNWLSEASIGVRVNLRKMVLGHAMRVGLQGGFGNLSCIRVSLGPSDMLLDNVIFNFSSVKGVAKFSLVGNGDFEFLDTILGKGWDYKVGRGEDSFFKFITEVQVKRSADVCLFVVAKFSQSQSTFSPFYRDEYRKSVNEGREQMETVIL